MVTHNAFVAEGHALSAQTSQKKMGLIFSIVSKTATRCLEKEALAYNNPETPRTMFMELLLFEEMDETAIVRFREIFKAQLGNDEVSNILATSSSRKQSSG